MNTFFVALVPIILVVALGRILAWRGTIAPDGWKAIEKLAYVLLFPALIIRALANAPFENAPWGMMAALIGGQLLLGGIGLLARFGPAMPRPAIGSIIQSNVRWNTFVALSLGSALYGQPGLALVTLAAAAMIPTANILSVYALMAHADTDSPRRNPIAELARNPLIIACLIGGAIAVSGFKLPQIADDTLRILAQATIALGLLAAGAGVDFSVLKRAGPRTLFWSLTRLIGLPLGVLACAIPLGVTGMPLAIAVICSSVPTAVNSYILARLLGGDAPLAANLIAVQTVISAVTMPLIWFACLSFGVF